MISSWSTSPLSSSSYVSRFSHEWVRSYFSVFLSLFSIDWPLITVPGKVGKLLSVGLCPGQHPGVTRCAGPGCWPMMSRARPRHHPLQSPALRAGPGTSPPRLQILAWFLASLRGKVWWLWSIKILHQLRRKYVSRYLLNMLTPIPRSTQYL